MSGAINQRRIVKSTKLPALSSNVYEWVRPVFHCFYVLAILLNSCKEKDEPDPPVAATQSPFSLGNLEATYLQDQQYDSKEKTNFDIWMPEHDAATGLVIYVHGGGFRGGDKDFVYATRQSGKWNFPEDIRRLLTEKIAVASINYSLISQNSPGVQKCFIDVVYAVQFFKFYSDRYNIDPSKIVLAGNSAGGGLALWVATVDDLGRVNSEDSIRRESSRVKAAVSRRGQASYDLKRWPNDVFIDYGITFDDLSSNEEFLEAIELFYDIDTVEDLQLPEIVQLRNRLDILDLISADDPELFLSNVTENDVFPTDFGEYNHHIFHIRELIEACTSAGTPFVGYYGENPLLYGDPNNENWVDFCIRKINFE